MQEKTLLKISIASSLIGLLLLSLLVHFTNIETSSINQLTINDLDKTIKVTGIVTRVTPTESITIIDVAQHNKMPVVVFEPEINLNPGDEIECTGTIEEYNGKIELIADKIERK